jgi:hypothetical protein
LNEATERLEQLVVENNRQVSIYALGQLWSIRLEQKRYEDAYATFESLSSRYSAKMLQPYIPAIVTKEIIDHYHQLARGVHQFAFTRELAKRLHNAVAVEEFFGIKDATHDLTRVYLCRAYFLAGRNDEALLMTEAVLDDHASVNPENMAWWFWLFEEYVWLLRLRGDTERAIEQVNDHLLDKAGALRVEHLPLLVERARLHAALADYEAASADLAEFHRQTAEHQVDYLFRVSALLLKGFLLEREGDEEAAQLVWREGLPSQHPDYAWLKQQNPYRFAYALILASLTGEFSDEDVQWIMDKAVPQLQALNYPVINATMRNFLPEFTPAVIASIVRETFRSDRGRTVARQIAFRDQPPMELIRNSVATTFVESTRQLVFDSMSSDRQEELVAELAMDGFEAVSAGTMTKIQLLQLAFTWKGFTSFVGWGALAPTLAPKLRGPLAYVFGVRYLQFDRPTDARMFFQSAIQDAGDNETLHELAEEALAELNEPKPK